MAVVTRDEVIDRLRETEHGVAVIAKDGRKGLVLPETQRVVWDDEEEEDLPGEFELVHLM